MKLSVTTTHELTFAVEYFHQEEGGMSNERFGEGRQTLQEAIELLTIAKNHSPKNDWIITVDVKTTVK